MRDAGDERSTAGGRTDPCPAETIPGSIGVTGTVGTGDVCTAVVTAGCRGVAVTEGMEDV